jgi:hypothetical protein
MQPGTAPSPAPGAQYVNRSYTINSALGATDSLTQLSLIYVSSELVGGLSEAQFAGESYKSSSWFKIGNPNSPYSKYIDSTQETQHRSFHLNSVLSAFNGITELAMA